MTGAANVALRLGLSEIVIGLTVVAFGTSAPELVVNLISALTGNVDLALGNIIGSNIANILLILGIAGVMAAPLAIKQGTVWREIPFALLACLVLLVSASDRFIDRAAIDTVTRSDGVVMLFFFVIFLFYTFSIRNKGAASAKKSATKPLSLGASLGFVTIGLAGLIVGGQLIVQNASILALTFGVSQSLVGLTIVAVGTSLPELATTVMAALRKKMDLAVGNIVGSNIFNIFFILGMTALIRPLPVPGTMFFDMIVAVAATLLLFLLMYVGKRHSITRGNSWFFMCLYVAYIIFLGWRG